MSRTSNAWRRRRGGGGRRGGGAPSRRRRAPQLVIDAYVPPPPVLAPLPPQSYFVPGTYPPPPYLAMPPVPGAYLMPPAPPGYGSPPPAYGPMALPAYPMPFVPLSATAARSSPPAPAPARRGLVPDHDPNAEDAPEAKEDQLDEDQPPPPSTP